MDGSTIPKWVQGVKPLVLFCILFPVALEDHYGKFFFISRQPLADPTGVLTYLQGASSCLAHCASLRGQTATAGPHISIWLMNWGVSRKTIQNHLQALSRAKLIQIQSSRAGVVLRYYPFLEASNGAAGGQAFTAGQVVQPSISPDHKAAAGCVKVTHNNINNINTNPPYPPKGERPGCASRLTSEAGEEDFAHLWAAWPVHQSEKEARRVFLRLRRADALPGVDALIRTVATFQERDSRWTRGKVKLLSNWLRGHCWNDQPYVEPRFSAGGGIASSSAPLPSSEILPRLNQRQEVSQACSRKEPSSPLPEPDALNELVSLWPKRSEVR